MKTILDNIVKIVACHSIITVTDKWGMEKEYKCELYCGAFDDFYIWKDEDFYKDVPEKLK